MARYRRVAVIGDSMGGHAALRLAAASVLDDLRVPALIVAETRDPLVTARSLAPHLARLRPRLTVRWTDRGGHVGYPGHGRVLARTHPPTVESQVLAWLGQLG